MATVYHTVKLVSGDNKYVIKKFSFPTKKEAELYIQKETDRLEGRTSDAWYDHIFRYVIINTKENYGLPPC